MPADGGLHPLALRQRRLRPLGPMQTLQIRAVSRRLTLGSHRCFSGPICSQAGQQHCQD